MKVKIEELNFESNHDEIFIPGSDVKYMINYKRTNTVKAKMLFWDVKPELMQELSNFNPDELGELFEEILMLKKLRSDKI